MRINSVLHLHFHFKCTSQFDNCIIRWKKNQIKIRKKENCNKKKPLTAKTICNSALYAVNLVFVINTYVLATNKSTQKNNDLNTISLNRKELKRLWGQSSFKQCLVSTMVYVDCTVYYTMYVLCNTYYALFVENKV